MILPRYSFVLLLSCLMISRSVSATTYYFHPKQGNDQYTGTSVLVPFQTLDRIETLQLQAGDSILLAAGQVFAGSLELIGQRGSKDHPIVITAYSLGPPALSKFAQIDAQAHPNGLLLQDCSFIQVSDLHITANGGALASDSASTMRCGVLVQSKAPGTYEGIDLSNLIVEDIFFEDKGYERGKKEVRTANGTQRYGWGIRFINRVEGALLKDIRVAHCQISNVAHTGIKFTGKNRTITDVKVYDCQVLKTGGPGMQMSGVVRGHIARNYISRSGSPDDSRKWGRGSGLWTWGSSHVLIEKNQFLHANGPGDSAGCHIDFNCENIVVQYNFSAHNAGGFCEILGNNYNCAYRYNISVNDGHRVKGEKGAFQEGKTFWLSGFAGKNRRRIGPFNSYFYNNTIIVEKDIVSKIAIDRAAKGILIMNNIFYIQGESQLVLGDQYRPATTGASSIDQVIFKNNLYLKPQNWPKAVMIQDEAPILGDPHFSFSDELGFYAYLPEQLDLIKDKGKKIPRLPLDKIGLAIGLEVEHDFLGRKIKGKPDMGALEVE